MENGKNHFYGRNSRLMVDSDGNTTPVVNHGDRIILVYRHMNIITKSCQSFINRIVDNLIYKMMQSSAGCTSDIHTRSFSDRLQTLKNLNLICSIFCTHIVTSYIFYQEILPSTTWKTLFILKRLFTKSSRPVQVIRV